MLKNNVFINKLNLLVESPFFLQATEIVENAIKCKKKTFRIVISIDVEISLKFKI